MEEEKPTWDYKSDDEGAAEPAGRGARQSVSWTASEYIDHKQGAGWYAMLLLATLVLAAGIYFLTKDLFATAVVVVVGVIVGVAAARKPQQVTYEISMDGVRIGEKTYPYSSFRSFSIIQEGGLSSISLLPLKRFMPSISIFYAPSDEEKIVDILGAYLPFEEHKIDAIDRLSRRLRF